MHDPPDYNALERVAWLKNAEAVLAKLNDRDRYILKKMRTYGWRFGHSEQAVENHIREDQMFAAWFAKEPRRTRFHERIASEWLQGVPSVECFETLPVAGKDAWYIATDGELRQGKKPPGVKSLDFRWCTRDHTVYASHKYTKEGGGNQDSQYSEVQATLKYFQQCADSDNTVLLAIVDGPYYTAERMANLHRYERTTPPISKALPIQDVPQFLETL